MAETKRVGCEAEILEGRIASNIPEASNPFNPDRLTARPRFDPAFSGCTTGMPPVVPGTGRNWAERNRKTHQKSYE